MQLNLNVCTTECCDSGRITVELPELVEQTWTLAFILGKQHNAGGIYWSSRWRNHHLLKEKVHKAVGIGAFRDQGEDFLLGWWQGL